MNATLIRRFIPSLLLDFCHLDRTDLAGARHVSSPTGLGINARNRNDANPSLPRWRFDRHGTDHVRVGGKLIVRDPGMAYGNICRDQLIQLAG